MGAVSQSAQLVTARWCQRRRWLPTSHTKGLRAALVLQTCQAMWSAGMLSWCQLAAPVRCCKAHCNKGQHTTGAAICCSCGPRYGGWDLMLASCFRCCCCLCVLDGRPVSTGVPSWLHSWREAPSNFPPAVTGSTALLYRQEVCSLSPVVLHTVGAPRGRDARWLSRPDFGLWHLQHKVVV